MGTSFEPSKTIQPMSASYSWSKGDDKDNVDDRHEFNLLFKRALKGWVISTVVFACLFFLYQFFLVPSIKIVELIAKNDLSTVQTHTILKSVILVLFIISCLNLNMIVFFYLLVKKNDFNISKKTKTTIKVFSYMQNALYVTLFLLIIAKHAKTFLSALQEETKK